MSDTKQTAFMQAYKDCHGPFLRYCSAIAYGRMDVQDLVQDVLLSAYQQFDRIERKDQLLHYLVRAARNRAASAWRLGRRSADLCERQTARLQERGATPEQLLDVQLLYKALDRLPEQQREALVLFEVSGLSMAEIAVIQNCAEGAVKTRVSRARAALRGRLEGRSELPAAAILHVLILLLP